MRNGAPSVCVVAATPPPVIGSAVAVAAALEGPLREAGHLTHVNTAVADSVDDLGRITVRKLVRTGVAMVRLAWVLVTTRPDVVVYVPTFGYPWFLRDVVTVGLVRTLSASTLVAWLHTSSLPVLLGQGPGWARRLARVALGATQHFAVLADGAVQRLHEHLPAATCTTVPNWIPQATCPVLRRDPREGVHVVYLSNMLEEKGWRDLLAVATRIVAARTDVSFSFFGHPSLDSPAAAIADAFASLAPKGIRYHGPVRGDMKLQALQSADVFCLPSRFPNEAQPLVILEAMSAGCPIVSTCIGLIEETVGGSNGGVFVPPGDRDALEQAILRLVDDPPLRARLGQANVRRVAEHYSEPAACAAWKSLLDRACPRAEEGSNG